MQSFSSAICHLSIHVLSVTLVLEIHTWQPQETIYSDRV